MNNFIIGIVCLALSFFIFFLSPNEAKNILGYKSPQQRIRKSNIWKHSNKCFGILALIGSFIYLLAAIITRILSINEYNNTINQFGIIYIFICIALTELYTFIRSQKERRH